MIPDVLAKSGEAAKSGPIGLAIILVLCIACYFLFKSMSKHLKAVREDFPSDASGTGETAEGQAPNTDAAPAAVPAEPVKSEADQPAEPPPAG
jgi:hypothetical protein